MEATGVDVVRVQRLSRHSRVDTVIIHNDSRDDLQAEITGLQSEWRMRTIPELHHAIDALSLDMVWDEGSECELIDTTVLAGP